MVDIGSIEKSDSSFKLVKKGLMMVSLVKKPLRMGDRIKVVEAIDLFTKAIQMDSLNYNAYMNRANSFCKLNDYISAFKDYKAVEKIKPSYAECISMQGFIYEKLGKLDTAQSYYSKAIEVYEKKLELGFDESDEINRAFLNFLLNEEKGLKEFQGLIEKHPDINSFLYWKEHLSEEFDRENYISGF